MTTERIIGNPIYNYQLLKRVTVYWSNVEKAIGKVDNKGTLARMKKLKSKHKKMPTEDDLKAAAKAINKLQDVYNIESEKLVLGDIGIPDNVETEITELTIHIPRRNIHGCQALPGRYLLPG